MDFLLFWYVFSTKEKKIIIPRTFIYNLDKCYGDGDWVVGVCDSGDGVEGEDELY